MAPGSLVRSRTAMLFTVWRQRGEEVLDGERPVQAHLQQADLLALRDQVLDRLVGGLGAGAHHDDDALGIGRADVVEQVVAGGRRPAANLSIAFCTMVGQAR